MTSLILGFYLGKETDKNDMDFYRFACVFPQTKAPRQIVKLRSCNGPVVASIGEVMKVVASGDKLADNDWCSFHKLDPPLYVHEKVKGGMVHTHQRVEILDYVANGTSQHPELGEMIDEKHLCVPGWYHSITFRIVIAEDTFKIEVLQAIRSQGILDEPETFRFTEMGKVLKIEKDTALLRENQNWSDVGNLKLIQFNYSSFFAGCQPVFKLTNDKFTELFQKRIENGGKILIFKQVKNQDGEWEDCEESGVLKGCAFNLEDQKEMCYVRMAKQYERLAALEMNLGDIYRFESDLSNEDIAFWEGQKHVNMELFNHTEEGEADLDMLQVLDARAIEAGDAPFNDERVGYDWLNTIQRKALEMARNEKRKLVCIQGPPGTGKSLVLATYIMSLLQEGKSAVVLTPTREALYNIKTMAEEVVKRRNFPVHRDAFMDTWTFANRMEETEAAKEGKKQLKIWRKELEKGKLDYESFIMLQEEFVVQTRLRVMKELSPNVKIVFATISSTFTRAMMKSDYFTPNVCIIDEASQVMEAQQWPACVAMQRIVMAGDPHQLPAVVLSEEGRSFQLQSSVLDRIMTRKERFSWIMLETQYRCHPDIISWSNNSFYEGVLQHHTGGKFLKDLITKNQPPRNIERIYDPMVMFDTSMISQLEYFSVRCFEKNVRARSNCFKTDEDATYANEGEAEIVLDHFKHIVNMGVDQNTIAIITPYRGQLELLQQMVKDQDLGYVQIGTVDAYQGQEFDVVIFSMVRSNPALHLGFVGDLRRLNVAITRAKYHFCFVGNAHMLYKTGQIREEFDSLLHSFMDSHHKFPPCFAKQVFKSFKKETLPKMNNFGRNFSAFKAHTKDPTMINFIEKWQQKNATRNSNKPN